ncbi:MAG: MSCRAMM family protein [Gemmatimonadaceae bacterium]
MSAVGCGEGINPATPGTIRLILTGLHPSATSGGTATATPIGGGQIVTVNIPASGDQSQLVPSGTYNVSYNPPFNHSLAPGTTVPSQVTIVPGETTTIEIALVSVGSISVTVTGLVGGPPNGGTATAQRTDAAGSPIPINIGANGAGSVSGIPNGVYSVTYAPPAGFNVTTTNPVTGITVGPGTSGSASFTVAPVSVAIGNVSVTVTGLTGAASGGQISARLTNNTGNTFTANLPAPTGDSSSGNLTGLPVGSYNVSYSAPSGFRLVNPASSPQPATVTDGGTANVSFTAEAMPAGGSILFQSDWKNAALGTSTASKSDGGKWNLLGGFGQECVDAAGLGFPSAKVCKFVANRQNSGFALNRKTGLPVIAVGTTRFYRWYVRMTFPDPLVGNGDHPWQDGNAVGDCNFIVGVHYGSDVGPARNGQWQIGMTFILNPNGAFDNGPWLNKGQTYRVEMALNRLTTTTYAVQIRVFDGSSTTPLFTEADFPADFGGGTIGTRAPYTFAHIENTDGWNCGTNDFETAGNDWWTTTFDYGYQGCFAIGDNTGFLGPYGSVSGEG